MSNLYDSDIYIFPTTTNLLKAIIIIHYQEAHRHNHLLEKSHRNQHQSKQNSRQKGILRHIITYSCSASSCLSVTLTDKDQDVLSWHNFIHHVLLLTYNMPWILTSKTVKTQEKNSQSASHHFNLGMKLICCKLMVLMLKQSECCKP